MKYGPVVLLTLAGCSLTGPSEPRPEVAFSDIREQYEAGQRRLIKYGYDVEAVLSVDIHEAKFVPHDGPFWCGEIFAWGCTRGNTIEFDSGTLRVLIHEVGHFILRKTYGKHTSHCHEHWGSDLKQYSDCPESERRILGE